MKVERKIFSKFGKILLFLLIFAGSGYMVYQFAANGAGYDYQNRWELRKEPKTTFTYYFFWYDNNSGGDAANTVHIYNHPSSFFKLENNTLINSTESLSSSSVLIFNISTLNPAHHDFDMFQVKFNCTSDNLTVYGISDVDYLNYISDPTNLTTNIERYELTSGSSGFLRIPFRKSNVTHVVFQNQNSNSVQFRFEGRIFNDTLSHHPDGSKFEGDFSYNNVQWHKYEIENIMKAGIDVILPIYWGSWSGEFNVIGMQCFVQALELLELQYGLDAIPKIGMFMDTTAFVVARGEGANLTTVDGKALYSTFVNEFFAYFPAKYLFQVNGAELVWMYGRNFIGDIDDSTFDYALEKYSEQFGTMRKLAFVGVGFLDDARRSQIGGYTWGVSLNGARLNSRGIAIGSIGPGFYAEGAYRCGCQFDLGIRERDRANGQYLIDSFNQVKLNAQWIVFEVWNEYHEGNDLSYSLEYKDQYINLTRQLIDEFHTISLIDWRINDSILTATGCIGLFQIGVVIKDKKRNLILKQI